MAQKPVANALTLELEPVVAENLARHLETEDEWYAHDYVPFDQGENFAFLGGKDWDPSQVTLPKDVIDALRDPADHQGQPRRLPPRARRALHPRGQVGPLDRPLDRRGAPARHRAAQLPGGHPRDRPGRQRGRPRRARDEGLPRRQAHPDRDAGLHGVLRARATRCSAATSKPRSPSPCSRAWSAGSPRTRSATRSSSRNLVGHCLQEYSRDETIAAIARRAAALGVIGGDIDATRTSCDNVAEAGIFDDADAAQGGLRPHHAWGLADEPVLRSSSSRNSHMTRRAAAARMLARE